MLERWIADRPFREAHPPGQSDLDIARGTHAREILQDHWRNWIVESDWAWLAETGINTVRIPVSNFAFREPSPPRQIASIAYVFPGGFTSSPLPSRRLGLYANCSQQVTRGLDALAFLSCSRVLSNVLNEGNLMDPEAEYISDRFLSRLWRRSFCPAWHRVRRLCTRFR